MRSSDADVNTSREQLLFWIANFACQKFRGAVSE
jgi:hypothetical protein